MNKIALIASMLLLAACTAAIPIGDNLVCNVSYDGKQVCTSFKLNVDSPLNLFRK